MFEPVPMAHFATLHKHYRKKGFLFVFIKSDERRKSLNFGKKIIFESITLYKVNCKNFGQYVNFITSPVNAEILFQDARWWTKDNDSYLSQAMMLCVCVIQS